MTREITITQQTVSPQCQKPIAWLTNAKVKNIKKLEIIGIFFAPGSGLGSCRVRSTTR